jgi:hypothetical protein
MRIAGAFAGLQWSNKRPPARLQSALGALDVLPAVVASGTLIDPERVRAVMEAVRTYKRVSRVEGDLSMPPLTIRLSHDRTNPRRAVEPRGRIGVIGGGLIQ